MIALATDDTFVKPHLAYGSLWPILVVFGAACVGVLIEAFLPRQWRYVAQFGTALVAIVVALVGVGFVADGLPQFGDGTARGIFGSEGTIALDGPTMFLWGLVLVFGLGGVLLFAERRVEGGVSAFAGQAAALPGTESERQSAGLDHTEVYPLLLFALGGMMLFPASGDLLTMFVALEVLSLPLYLLCGLARRRRLLSQEAAMKYFLLGAFSSGFFLYGVALIYGYAGSMDFGAINEAVSQQRRQPDAPRDRHGHADGGPAVQGRCRAVPGVGARRLPGRPDRGHGVHGGSDQGRGVRRDPAALLRRLRRGALDVAADDVGDRDPDDDRRHLARAGADGHEADARLLLGGAHRLPAHRCPRPAERGRDPPRTDHLAPGGPVLPGDLRTHHARRLRGRRAGPRLGRRAVDDRPLGRARQALAGRGRSVLAVPAQHGRHPAHRRVSPASGPSSRSPSRRVPGRW